MGANMLETSKVRRSISCYSLPTLGIDDENEETEERREMHEALRVRKEALQGALNTKLAELKALCLREADLTGELPPETPLRPNEPRPVIRRRMRTEFALNDKLLTESKSEEEETLAKMELEFDIQSKIVAALMKLMNEHHMQKSIRKQRKVAHDDAVNKLNALEKKLIPLRKKLEEGRKSNTKKKQLIQELNKDSGISDVNLNFAPDEFLDDKRTKKRRMKLFDNPIFDSEPPSPLMGAREPHLRDQNAAAHRNFVPISPAAKHFHKIHPVRPTSANLFASRSLGHFADDTLLPPKTVHFSSGSSDPDSVSMNSDGMASVIIHSETPPLPRKGILMNKSKNNSKPRYRPATAVGLPYASDDNQIKRSNTIGSGSHSRLENASPIDDFTDRINGPTDLERTNSLDNSRRKSYISAIYEPNTTTNHHQHYLNHHPRFMRQSKTLPKNPPPPVPTSVNMAQRPLPPPPSIQSQSLSVPDVSARVEEESNLITSVKISTSVEHRFRKPRDPVDQCPRPVRSSVIRTPVAITISTTSSSEASCNANNISASPSPSPNSTLRRTAPASRMPPVDAKPATPVPAPVHSARNSPIPPHQVMENWAAMPNTSEVPPRPPSVSSMRRSEKKPPMKPPPIPIITAPELPYIDEPRLPQFVGPPGSDELDNISFDGAAGHGRANVETPRPATIPLSPTVANANVELDVVSVGTFTPYWEESKPFELSDFYKYSAKHRNKNTPTPSSSQSNAPSEEPRPNENRGHQRHGGDFQMPHPPKALMTKPHSDVAGHHLAAGPSVLNESFIVKSAVAKDFHEEMYDWYDENLKNATVV